MNNVSNYFVKNYKPILVSFFLSMLLWIVVATDKTYSTIIEVPLKISHLPQGYVLKELPPEKIVLEVGGSGRSLIALNFNEVSMDLELTDFKNDKTIILDDYKNQLNIPRTLAVSVIDIIEPKKINIKVDKFIQVKKPILLNAEIKPSPGYILMGYIIQNDSIEVSGPESLISEFNYISTEEIKESGVKYPFRKKLNLTNPFHGLLNFRPNNVDVQFRIEQLVERVLYNLPVQIVGVPDGIEARALPAVISLRVKGGESYLTDLVADEITVLFDFSRNYVQGENVYPMMVQAPSDITVLSLSPEKFKLQLRKRDIIE